MIIRNIGNSQYNMHPTCASTMCRHALEQEADVLCLLAKVESSQLAFESAMAQSEGKAELGSKGGSITAVVQEGLQVQVPMAGMQ